MIKKTAILIICLCIVAGVTISSMGGFSELGGEDDLAAKGAEVAGITKNIVIDSDTTGETELTLLVDALNIGEGVSEASEDSGAAMIYAAIEANEQDKNGAVANDVAENAAEKPDENAQQTATQEATTRQIVTETTTEKETSTEKATVTERVTVKATTTKATTVKETTTEKATVKTKAVKESDEQENSAKVTTTKATTAKATTTKATTTKAAKETVKANSVSDSVEDILNSVTLKPDRFLSDGDTSNDRAYHEAQWFSLYNEKGVSIEGAEKLVEDCIAEITADCDTNYEKVMACYDFVQLQVDEHTGGYGNWLSIYSIFRYRKGTCYDYNYLFMTMMRYLGYNARMARGMTARAGGGMTEHAWAEVIIDGTVYIFDPQVDDDMTGRKSTTTGHTRFCKTYSQLSGKYDKEE